MVLNETMCLEESRALVQLVLVQQQQQQQQQQQ
jgi:hypothetical protein